MKITSKNGNELNFLETGVDGIYILDHAAFKEKFDEGGNNGWEKSSGKKKLQKWAEKNLTKEILEQFDIDIPTVEEVFSQKMLNLYESSRNLKSRQFPIFQNSDNRMMELDGKPMWWWTRSAYADSAYGVWTVYPGGGMHYYGAYHAYGFVPVLRRKTK